MQLYCPQCDAPVPDGASRCTSCPARFGEGSAWKPAPKIGLRERVRLWRQSPGVVVPSTDDFMRISLVAACAGVGFGVLFFLGFFFAVPFGGVMGSANLPAYVYVFMIGVALWVIGPGDGGLFAASYFWGAVAGVSTFAVLAIRAGRRRAKEAAGCAHGPRRPT